MKIKQISIKRFRSILSLDLVISDLSNLITICGANNTGKTNVLRAVDIFFNPIKFEVDIDSPNHKYYGTRGGKAFPEISITFHDSGKEIKIIRKFNLEGSDELSGMIKDGQNSSAISSDQCKNIIDDIYFFYIPSINISFPELISSLIDDIYDIEYDKSRFKGLKQELKESFEKYINGTLEVLNQLANEINPIFSEFNENWSVAFEFTSDIEKFRDIISNEIEFYLNDKSNRNIEGKGSGLQRLGYILLHSRIIKKISKKNVLLLIDEPDIYLHQGLQRKLLNHLQELAVKYQIFLTTHSPIFIDSYKLQNVFLLELEIGQEQSYQRVNKAFHTLSTKLVDITEYTGLKKIQEYLGIQTDDYEILDIYNIIVEGDSDKKYLEETAKFFKIPTSRIIPIHGISKCEKYLDFYNSFYEERSIKPTILILFDNDPAGRDEFKKLTKKFKAYNNISVHFEFTPTAFGHQPDQNAILKDGANNENFEIEDFIYPELIVNNTNVLIAKKGLAKIQFKNLETKIKARSFKDKGILYNLELLKNERNLENGNIFNLSSENAKNGISGLYNLKGNKTISDQVISLDKKYPFVKSFIEKIMDAKNYCK